MPEYLPLCPLGADTLEVESLRSYICRLAKLHCVTLTCFMRHVASSCKRPSERRALERFMTQASNACGIGPNVGLLVRVLGALTGQRSLKRMTLLGLDRVVSGGQGITKLARSWCPECYWEHQVNASTPYDRLLWTIPFITRCPVHKVALVDQCPRCSEVQRNYHRSGRIDICSVCEGSLISDFEPSAVVFEPQYGESHCCDMVLAITHGDFKVRRYAVQIFSRELALLHGNRPHSEEFSEILDYQIAWWIKHRSKPFRFMRLLRIATELDIRLVDFLCDPVEAAHLAGGLLHDHIGPPTENYTRLGDQDRALIRSRLTEELNRPAGELLATKKQIAGELGVSISALRYAGSELMETYERQRAVSLRAAREARKAVMRSLLNEELLPRYLSHQYRSRRELAFALSNASGASIRSARIAVNEALSGHQTE